ncbi:tail fiber domain-containing protein [Myroides odoratus]|uniref:tail fiber domain-containing protein n=1 Tax=Myroides odoratus TaxID=256 RepID=UPI0039B11CBA
MKQVKYILSLVIYLKIFAIYGQVGINTPQPHPSAALEIASSNQGFLPPRVPLKGKKDQITIDRPAIGLLIYNTVDAGTLDTRVLPGYYYWNGTNWNDFQSNTDSWDIKGNDNINDKLHFIGTKTDMDVLFKRNNIESGRLSNMNTSFGVSALSNLISEGQYNTAIGINTLRRLEGGTMNTAIGFSALENNNYYSNIGIGAYALQNSTQGFGNVGIGNFTMRRNSQGVGNSSLGNSSLSSMQSGNWNIGIGQYAGSNLLSGDYNILIGASTDVSDINGSNQLNIGNSIYGLNINTGKSKPARIGINTKTPHSSAVLDLSANNMGFLPPRVSLKGIDDLETILNPAKGLLVFNTSLVQNETNPVYSGYYYFNGKQWVMLSTADNTWSTKGNSNTDSSQNFIGTTDNQDLIFKRHGVQAGLLSDINTYNTSFGVGSYKGTPKGTYHGRWNTAIGYNSLNGENQIISGHDNTAVGANSLKMNSTGEANTAIGSSVLKNNTKGLNNTGVGMEALVSNSYGNYNVAMGRSTLLSNTYGSSNTGIGYRALNTNINGSFNTAIGYGASIDALDLTNTTTVGNGAKVYRSNHIRFGNENVVSIYGQVPFSAINDKRSLENISLLPVGLDLVTKLKPMQYTRIGDSTQKKEWGIVAQDLQQTLTDLDLTHTGIIQSDNTQEQVLILRYTDLIAPMIKAIQELSQENQELKARLDRLEN